MATPSGDMLGFLLGLQPMSGGSEGTAAPAAAPAAERFLDDSAEATAFVRGGVPAAHAWLPEQYVWNPTTFVRARTRCARAPRQAGPLRRRGAPRGQRAHKGSGAALRSARARALKQLEPDQWRARRAVRPVGRHRAARVAPWWRAAVTRR
jgi:hypothetical protein